MKRLVFLVEGDTEIIFIHNHVIPHLYSLGFANTMTCQKIITNRKLHKKGGNVNYDLFKNDVERILAQPEVLVTTFLDFFRLPNNFPGYTLEVSDILNIENGIHEDFNNNPNLIPYIQKHEVEALMYSSMDGFEIVVDDQQSIYELKEIIKSYPNPENINNRPETAPSKRLEKIFKYDKVIDSEMIFDAIGIDAILLKCPRFAEWIKKLKLKLSE